MIARVYVAPLLVAAAMSYVSSRYLFVGSGLNLIPWALLAMLWGLVQPDRRLAIRSGAVFGFALSFVFLWIDKSGHTSSGQFVILLVVIGALGVFGGACGAVLSAVTYHALRRCP
jgi:hypothetical protein